MTPQIPTPPLPLGVRLGVDSSQTTYKNRPDVLVGVFPPQATIAAAFTQNVVAAAPVILSKQRLMKANPPVARGLVVNSGNANACAPNDLNNAAAMTAQLAQCADIPEQHVFVASTGVIGEPLPIQPINNAVERAAASLNASLLDAAGAILTTDTKPKIFTDETHGFSLQGFAKGSGMIAPNLATMLAFLFTDADVPHNFLHDALHSALPSSFNALSIDSDQSTNDTVFLIASAARGRPDEVASRALRDLVRRACESLAEQIARDGEGASKLLRVAVTGAKSDASARAIARSIAQSPLVKTALAGEDPNWGRIAMAAGNAGEPINTQAFSITLNKLPVALNGQKHPLHDEHALLQTMKQTDITIAFHAAVGDASAQFLSCDLTKQYVAINADYRS